MRRTWEINRRAVLRGAGIAIGLPLLEAMVPGVRRARAAGIAAPKRLVLFIFEGGTPDTTGITGGGRPGSLRPASTGPDYETTPILQPFADLGLKQDITVVSNLHNLIAAAGDPPHDGGDHARGSAALLTGANPENIDRSNPAAATSVDQVAANAFKAQNPALLPQGLVLGLPANRNSELYVSWTGKTSPLIPIEKPSDAFLKVFGEAGDPKALQKRVAYRESVLHYAADEIGRLQGKLGKSDKDRLDNYLTGIHDLEDQIFASKKSGNQCAGPGQAANDGGGPDQRLKQMLDLVPLAFACDRTRVAVVNQFFRGERYRWLGSPHGDFEWHADVEHAGEFFSGAELEVHFDAYAKGCAWTMDLFGNLVDKMKKTTEADGGGSLLDSSLLVCTSELSYGNGHTLNNLPVVMAGRAGGIKQGRHIAPKSQPISNLWVTLLNALDISTSTFGDSTGPLDLG